MSKTTIAWTQATWNPVRGCTRISDGCRFCYAERMAARALPGMLSPASGEPFAVMTPSGPRWTGEVELIPHMLDIPLRTRKPTTWFVNSMSDLFHEALTNEDIRRVFQVICECRGRHVFQILTKRAARLPEWFAWAKTVEPGWFNSHGVLDLWQTWLGVSVEDQQRADERIPHLLRTPAAVRFISAEPLLGPVGLANHFPHIHGMRNDRFWVIVGGESGPRARPMNLAWARSLVEQCKAAGVACFMKQLGPKPVDDRLGEKCLAVCGWPFGSRRVGKFVILNDKKGGGMSEWPEDLRVREFPQP